MKGRSPQGYTLGLWTNFLGTPQMTGVIPSGSVVTVTVWMRKTSAFGVVYPYASVQTVETLDVNYQPKAQVCAGTGTTALDTTLRAYTLTCTTTEPVAMASADRFAVFVGFSMTQGPGNRTMIVELHIEGSADSRAVLPLPASPPSITSLTPSAAAADEPVTIAGANFGASQGTSTVQFNGVAALPTSWTATSITAPVPPSATSGPVIVTVGGAASNGASFTVITPPSVTAINPNSGIPNQTVTIFGSSFGAVQGTSTVAFNGVVAATTSWSETSIAAVVPSGAITGPVVVTVGGRASNGADFTIISPPTLTSLTPTSGYPGDTVTLSGQDFGPGSPVVTFNGTAAVVTNATLTSITTTVPELATSGPVVVTLDGQTSNGISFTVLSDTPATLTVRVYDYDELAAEQQGPPAGAGVYVRVDGVDVGQTAEDGTLTVQVLPGERLVTAIEPSMAIGNASIALSPGASETISIVLQDGKEVFEPTALIILESVDAIVPFASPTFTMGFLKGTDFAPVTRLVDVDLLGREGNIIWALKSMFTISNGQIIAANPQAMFYWLPWDERVVLRVQAEDANGFSHSGAVWFSVGQFTLNLTLASPPSNPALSVAGVDVDVAVTGTPIVLRRTSDGQGQITIPSLPYATLVLSSTATAGGKHYYGWTTLTLAADSWGTLVMRNVVDVLNEVPPLITGGSLHTSSTFSVTTEASAIRSQYDAAMQEMLRARQAAPKAPSRSADLGTGSALASTMDSHQQPVTLSVTSDGADEPVYQNASLTVPQGTEKVVLKYNVTSLEYPEWVRQQSPFDDVWSLAVYGGAGGAQLFQTWRNVNSQLAGAPAWQMDASIGGMQEELDISELTADGDIQLVMVASAVNVRDYHFDTTVTAELGGVGTLQINTVTKDELTKTKSDSQFVSIPRPNTKNHHERWFTLNVSKPKPEAEIKKVRVVLLNGAGGTLQDLFEAAPGDNVKLEKDGEIVKVRITMHDVNSSVPSTPPSTHFIRYRFEVQAEVDGEFMWSNPQRSEDLIALWRMPGPGVFARYPVDDRDPGLDDWGIRGTYEWLAQNVSLFTKTSINDISGEHAWDIGHTQHARGVEIDIFHFKRMPGAWNARSNYILLRDHVLKAVDGNAHSKGLVKEWVEETRTGFDGFIPLPEVERLYMTQGQPHKLGDLERLPLGWGEQLIKTGILIWNGKTLLDLTIGEWSNKDSAKLRFNKTHDDHGHITLNAAKLPK